MKKGDETRKKVLVRDFILKQQEEWLVCLSRIARSAVLAGDFRPDSDCDQFAFEPYSLMAL